MKTKTFNIILPEELVRKADLTAKKEYRNRSELIREALNTYINRAMAWETVFAAGEKVARASGIKNESEVAKIVSDFRSSK
ncbi:MAG: ribbon-helix-helix domain-containing protein [Candidatus Berkelbacteria bacterium]|nr:ribbon-helix-helix domain-containing protein [Candidatus Berkelbacteria bacterium]